jgi:hypothetical protein
MNVRQTMNTPLENLQDGEGQWSDWFFVAPKLIEVPWRNIRREHALSWWLSGMDKESNA